MPVLPPEEDGPCCPVKLNTLTGTPAPEEGVLEDTAMGPPGLIMKVVAGVPPPPAATNVDGEVTDIPSPYWT